MTLADFLLARIVEDEGVAESYGAHVFGEAFAYNWDVKRVLAECEAKRRIVGLMLSTDHAEIHADAWTAMKWVTHLLALPYADHPDYREEWKP